MWRDVNMHCTNTVCNVGIYLHIYVLSSLALRTQIRLDKIRLIVEQARRTGNNWLERSMKKSPF